MKTERERAGCFLSFLFSLQSWNQSCPLWIHNWTTLPSEYVSDVNIHRQISVCVITQAQKVQMTHFNFNCTSSHIFFLDFANPLTSPLLPSSQNVHLYSTNINTVISQNLMGHPEKLHELVPTLRKKVRFVHSISQNVKACLQWHSEHTPSFWF